MNNTTQSVGTDNAKITNKRETSNRPLRRNNFKYELRKGSKHIICPNCGKKTFKPYVYVGTDNIVNASRYGRCERINNCQYNTYPSVDNTDNWQTPPEPRYIKKPPTDFIPCRIVDRSFSNFNNNPFYLWLCKVFDSKTAYKLQAKYLIGTAKNGGTIFWQRDKEGRFRTGKVIYYQSNGKRKRGKNHQSWYVHNRVKENFQLNQVFYGEHLTRYRKPIALCESEKTAICMSVFEPEYNWLASGGAMMLNSERLKRVKPLNFVSPDNRMYNDWMRRTKNFLSGDMDYRVERAVKDGILKEGADILDLILKEKGLENV